MTFFRLICLILTVLFSLPVSAQEADTTASGEIATRSDTSTDAAIAVRIRNILAELGGYEDVTVTVNEGIVRLRGTTASATEAQDLTTLVGRVQNVVTVRNEVTETTELARKLNPALARFEARVQQLVTVLPLVLIAVAVFALIAFAGRFISNRERPWSRLAPNAFIADLYRQIVMILFVVVGLVIALDILNASALLGTILGAAGIVGLAFGFAVRDTVENYIASIMLSIRQPFRPNDTIEINGDEGKVIRLTSRATILMSFDGNQIRIPNATVFKSRIVNYSLNAERRFKFTITIASDADLSAIQMLVTRTVQALPFSLPAPPALAWVEGFNDAGIELVVTGWIDQNVTSIALARGEALRQVKLTIENAGVTIPDKGYRITFAGQSEKPTGETGDQITPPVGAAPTPAKALPAVSDDHLADQTDDDLERIIEAERGQDMNQDLLRPDARTE